MEKSLSFYRKGILVYMVRELESMVSSRIVVERMKLMRIDDEMLDKLGTYFVYHEVYNRYGITFEIFVDRWVRGILDI